MTRPFRYDPQLDPIADMLDLGDTEAWQLVPPRLLDHASIYRDLRAQHRAPVRDVPDDVAWRTASVATSPEASP